MTKEQKKVVKQLEQMYGSPADNIEPIPTGLKVEFSPWSIGGVSFLVSKQGLVSNPWR